MSSGVSHGRKLVQGINKAGDFEFTVEGHVTRRWKLREKEFDEGTVFNVQIEEQSPHLVKNIKIYFRDEWAEPCSFIEIGNTVRITAGKVEQNPAHSGKTLHTEHPFFLVASPASELKVFQECGDEVVEMTIHSKNLQNPAMKVSKKSSFGTKVMANNKQGEKPDPVWLRQEATTD